MIDTSIDTFLLAPGNDILNLTSLTYTFGHTALLMAGGNDIAWASAGNDFISGASGDDILHGGPGNDLISGGEHNDIINGGIGTDTALYQGLISDYDIIQTALGVYQVTSIEGYVDTLSNIEIINFGNSGFIGGNNYNLSDLFAMSPPSVPEPSTLALLGLGIAGFGFFRKNKNYDISK